MIRSKFSDNVGIETEVGIVILGSIISRSENQKLENLSQLSTYQLVMNKQIAQDLEPLGLIGFPQHKHLVTIITVT